MATKIVIPLQLDASEVAALVSELDTCSSSYLVDFINDILKKAAKASKELATVISGISTINPFSEMK